MMPHATNGLGAAVARLLRRHPQGASGGPVATAAGPYRRQGPADAGPYNKDSAPASFGGCRSA